MTQNDKPVAIVIGVAGMDEEQLQLSTSDQFWKLIAKRRGQRIIDRAELERRVDSRSEQQPARIATTTLAIAEPKPDNETGND